MGHAEVADTGLPLGPERERRQLQLPCLRGIWRETLRHLREWRAPGRLQWKMLTIPLEGDSEVGILKHIRFPGVCFELKMMR